MALNRLEAIQPGFAIWNPSSPLNLTRNRSTCNCLRMTAIFAPIRMIENRLAALVARNDIFCQRSEGRMNVDRICHRNSIYIYNSQIDPLIFGTLFECGLDPNKRSQLGAHYTDREKIMLLVAGIVEGHWTPLAARLRCRRGTARYLVHRAHEREHHGSVSQPRPLTESRSFVEALNAGVVEEGMSKVSPVRGLRPRRGARVSEAEVLRDTGRRYGN